MKTPKSYHFRIMVVGSSNLILERNCREISRVHRSAQQADMWPSKPSKTFSNELYLSCETMIPDLSCTVVPESVQSQKEDSKELGAERRRESNRSNRGMSRRKRIRESLGKCISISDHKPVIYRLGQRVAEALQMHFWGRKILHQQKEFSSRRAGMYLGFA